MRRRVDLLLMVLGFLGAGCILGEIFAKWTGWPQTASALGTFGLPAMWSYVVGIIVHRAMLAEASRAVAVPRSWLPEVVDIYFSLDLLPEVTRSEQELHEACKGMRLLHGIESPVVRVRGDALLANRSYTISINGIRISGGTLAASDDFQKQLVTALEDVWNRHGDAIRFFAYLQAQAA